MESMIPSLLAISAATNLFIGVLIFLQGYRGVFIFAILAVAFWDLSILSFHLNTLKFLNWASFSHFFALVVVYSYYLFAFRFPRRISRIKLSSPVYIFPAILFVGASVVIFFTSLIVGQTDYFRGTYVVGSYYAAYSLLITFYFSAGSLILFDQFRLSWDATERQQIRLVLLGAIVSILISTVADLLLPFFDIFRYIWVGPFSTILLVIAVSVAILKYHLFSIKLIIVETALIFLNFLLFANAAFSKESNILVLNLVLLLSVFILSIFLIRGIYKDIRDREQIEKLVKEMEQANQRLLALEQQKTEFVSIASHQLRTPMTVIKGYASMVLEGAFGVLPPQAKEAMGNLYKSSERIVALIEDLLTVSRIEQGRGLPVFQTINFTDFIREILVSFTADARVAGLKLAFTTTPGSEGAQVALDKKKFEQALRHIIDNAIKYTKAPGSVSVAISNDATNHKVFLSVSDTGMGMTEEQIKSLLEKGGEGGSAWGSFFGFTIPVPKEKDGADASMKKTRGIGFYIAQELITAHYGSIRIESEGLGKGATVVIELPEMREGNNQ